jgi:hypothetical protein
MRREPLFSRSGYYRFLLDCNVLLHREAAAAARAALAGWPGTPRSGSGVRVLDLACGGVPLTIAGVMGAFPDLDFHYTGVDVNPDQVSEASRFPFPPNVVASRVVEGNAWDLPALGLDQGFHLVYSGMNLHHGTPEEIRFLGLGIRALLARPGLFLGHDVYRPSDTLYRRRPDADPADPGCSWRLVSPDRLREAGIRPATMAEDAAPEEPPWRLDYLRRMGETLVARGGDPRGAASTVAHMRERDYPVSTGEFRRIFAELGFRAESRAYDVPDEPMAPYIGFCTATLEGPSPI